MIGGNMRVRGCKRGGGYNERDKQNARIQPHLKRQNALIWSDARLVVGAKVPIRKYYYVRLTRRLRSALFKLFDAHFVHSPFSAST